MHLPYNPQSVWITRRPHARRPQNRRSRIRSYPVEDPHRSATTSGDAGTSHLDCPEPKEEPDGVIASPDSVLVAPFVATVAAAVLAVAIVAPALAARHGTVPRSIDLPNGWAPEGITAGPGTTVFVGSLDRRRHLQGRRPDRARARILVEPSGRSASARSTRPTRTGCGSPAARRGQVRVYDASSGALLETYDVLTAGFLNDLVVTDARGLRHRLAVRSPRRASRSTRTTRSPTRPTSSSCRSAATSSWSPGFNLNGIVTARGWLIGVQSNTGKLFRIDPVDRRGDRDRARRRASTSSTATASRSTAGRSTSSRTRTTGSRCSRSARGCLGERSCGRRSRRMSSTSRRRPPGSAASSTWSTRGSGRRSRPTPYWITRLPR